MSHLKDKYPHFWSQVETFLDHNYDGDYDTFTQSVGGTAMSSCLFARIRRAIMDEDARNAVKAFIRSEKLWQPPVYWAFRLWRVWRRTIARPGTRLSRRRFEKLVLELYPDAQVHGSRDQSYFVDLPC